MITAAVAPIVIEKAPGFWNATIVAALIAATAALSVTVLDRLFAQRDAKRDARRAVYASFLGAARLASAYAGPAARGSDRALEIGHVLTNALGEVDLIAGMMVLRAANAYVDAITDKVNAVQPERAAALDSGIDVARDEFIRLARADVLSRAMQRTDGSS